jgi:hypothetical protein
LRTGPQLQVLRTVGIPDPISMMDRFTIDQMAPSDANCQNTAPLGMPGTGACPTSFGSLRSPTQIGPFGTMGGYNGSSGPN